MFNLHAILHDMYIFYFRATVCSLEDFEQKLNQVIKPLYFIYFSID